MTSQRVQYRLQVDNDPQGVIHKVSTTSPSSAVVLLAHQLRGRYPAGSVVRATHQGPVQLCGTYTATVEGA
jgi:hypothetical protein